MLVQGRQILLPAVGECTGGAGFSFAGPTGFCAITDAGLIVGDRRGG